VTGPSQSTPAVTGLPQTTSAVTGPPQTGPPQTGPPQTGPPQTGPPQTGPPPRGAAAATAAARSAAGLRRFLGTVVPPALVSAGAVGLWYLASYVLLTPDRRFLLPPPHAVVRVGFLDRANLAELTRALALSAQVALTGLAIAAALGVGLAVLMSQARWLERSLYPYAVVLQTIPVLALVPLLGFWFGFGFGSRVLVCVLVAIFPIIANTLFGLRSANRNLHDLFTLHRAGRLTRLVRLQLPTALPAMLTGLRVSAGLSVIGAIVGDFFFKQGQPGIGVLIDLYRQRLQSEQLFAAVLLASSFGVVVFWTFGLLASKVVGGWHESHRTDWHERDER
jgi:NitT/TauT family transport system permease protein